MFSLELQKRKKKTLYTFKLLLFSYPYFGFNAERETKSLKSDQKFVNSKAQTERDSFVFALIRCTANKSMRKTIER